MSDAETYKRQAGESAAELVENGMVVGLGTGSTAIHAVSAIAKRLEAGLLRDIVGIPTSTATAQAAERLGVPVGSLNQHPRVDLTIDGADEIAPNLDLIKGGGGALLREKVVAQASARQVIVADESKLSPVLGTNWPVPVEVIPFALQVELEFLGGLAAEVSLRLDAEGEPYRTDNGNLILDANFGAIGEPAALALQLNERAGIVEHGLFLGLATDLIVAGPRGLQHLTAER